jgi:hypothetical protein
MSLGEDTEPLVQFEDKDDDDDDDQEFDPYQGMKRSTPPPSRLCGKTAAIILLVLTVVALLIAVIGLILGGAGLNRASPSYSSQGQVNGPSGSATPPTKQPALVSNSNCGDGLWNKIIDLDMTDPAQECPRGWRGYEGSVRCCGRPVLVRSSCPAVFFPVNGYQYSKVCGRALGYQQGSPDGFASDDSGEPSETIDGMYVDGVSLTHGNPRMHIWTFAAGLLENGDNEVNNLHRCPCDSGQQPPAFVGQNYFCETGDHDLTHNRSRFYKDDPLWDGKNCVKSTCCTYHNPPWFSVKLPKPTTDAIEVRICGDQSTEDEDSPIAQLEIYVQK